MLFLRIATIIVILSAAVYIFVPASFYTATALFVLIGLAGGLMVRLRRRRDRRRAGRRGPAR